MKLLQQLSYILIIVSFIISCDSLSSEKELSEVEKKFDSVMVYTQTGKTMAFTKFIDSINTNKPIAVVTTYDFCGSCKRIIEALIEEKEKTQKFEVVAFFIEDITEKSKYIKNDYRFKKLVKKYNYNCPTIFDPTGSYTKHVLNGRGHTPQTNIIYNDSIVFLSEAGSGFISYHYEAPVIIDALRSKDTIISNTIKYPNNKIRLAYSFKNFKRNGEWQSKFEDGQLRLYQQIVNGKIEGEAKTYFENGQLKSVGNYQNGESMGEHKRYFKNGQIKSVSNFQKGEPIGEYKVFYENGQLKSITNYTDGKLSGEAKSYFENGQLKEIANYAKGKLNGESKIYFENGQLKEIRYYKNDEPDGEYKDYYDNGTLKRVFSYENSKASGEFKAYYNDGKIRTVSFYENGKRKGETKSYFQNGQISLIGNFANDNYEGEVKKYFDTGQLSSIGNYKNGKKEGEWKTFFKNGQVVDEGIYLNGEPNGEWKTYWSNGQLYQLKSWKNGKLIDIFSSFNNKGKAIEKGSLANGNGTRNHHNAEGKITSTDNYINGEKEAGYKERLANEKLFKKISNTKAKKINPETDWNKLVIESYRISNFAINYDEDYMAVAIPFEVPTQGEINFLIFDQLSFSLEIIANNLNDQLITSFYNLKEHKLYKEHSVYVNKTKRTFEENGKYFSYKTLDSNDLEMPNLRGQTSYILFKFSKKAYSKNKNSNIYLGYYTLKDLKEIDDFNKNLKSLDKETL